MDNNGLRLETRIDQDIIYLDVSDCGSYIGFVMYDPEKDKTVISNGLKEFLKREIGT